MLSNGTDSGPNLGFFYETSGGNFWTSAGKGIGDLVLDENTCRWSYAPQGNVSNATHAVLANGVAYFLMNGVTYVGDNYGFDTCTAPCSQCPKFYIAGGVVFGTGGPAPALWDTGVGWSGTTVLALWSNGSSIYALTGSSPNLAISLYNGSGWNTVTSTIPSGGVNMFGDFMARNIVGTYVASSTPQRWIP